MAKGGPKLRLRFRKSFPILGDMLKWTVSKKGVSLNARLGPLSKSWGTRGKNTTVDAPGAFGLFWRKQEGRSKRRADTGTGDAEADAFLAAQRSRKFWTRASLTVIAAEALVELVRMYNPLSECELGAHAGLTFLALVGAQVALVYGLRSMGVRGFLLLVLTAGGCWVQWKLFGSMVMDQQLCPTREEQPRPSPQRTPAVDD